MSGMSGMRGMNGLRADAVNSDSQPTVNRQSRLTSVQRHDSVTSAIVAREWLNGSTHLRVWPLKIVAVLAILLTIGSGNVWGATETVTISAIASANSWANATHYSGWTSSSGKFTFTAANSGQGLYYTSDNSWRGYKSKGSMVITAGSGITISSVTSSATASWSVASGGGSASFTPTATIKFTSFTITYTEAAAGPTITTSLSSLTEVGYSTADFSQQVKSFTVSGSSLTANVTVTAPTNYEVCKTSGGTYTSSVTFDKGSGTLATSTVYVRLQSGKTAGNYSGNVACSSSGATTKNVAVSGSVPFTVTWKANGTTHATTYVTYATGTGTALGTLPIAPDPEDYSCAGEYFYGWFDGVSYSNASVAPTIITTSTKITTDKTLLAVFADRSGTSKTYQFDITPSDFNSTSYAANNNEKTTTATATDASGATMSVKWTSNQIMLNSSDMQWKKNEGYIYNSTDLGTVNSVSITSSAGTYSTAYGTSSEPASGSQGSGNGYFKTTIDNTETGKTTKVRVNFTKSNYTYSNYATSCSAPSQCATPTFSVAAGTYNNNQSVGISCGTDGVTIRYTTDGTNPTKTTGTVYSTKISVTGTTTIKAIAYKDGLTDSDVASATFTLVCATPTLSPSAGSYCGDQSVTISCATDGATIRYTTNGNDPTESSTVYSSAISVTSTTTIKAKAFKTNYTASSIASATYTITTLTTMDEIYTAATSAGSTPTEACIKFNNWVVSGANSTGKTIYVTDGTKGFIIYDNTSDTGFRQGDILSGTVSCNVQLYHNAAELTSLTTSTLGLTVTKGGTVTPTVMNSSEIAALSGVNTGRVITTTGECESCNTTKQCINGAQLYNQLYSYTATTGTVYTATGVYVRYDATNEILPLGDLTTFTVTAVSNNVSYGTVSLTGSVITATPESGYRVSTTTAYTVTSGTATVTDNGDGTFTVTPSSDCTVRINFEATPTHNIIFNTGGLVTISNATVYEGDTYNISETPAASLTEDCEYSTFVGWTTVSSIADESVRPSIVSSVEMSTSDITLYAVYSKTSDGGGSGDYELVENDLGTDWAGDYLIAYSSTIFADGRVGGTGEGGIGAQSNQVNPSTDLSGTVVAASWGDDYYVTLEEISSGGNTYVLKTQDGKYNYQTSNTNGLTSTETKATAANYPITVTYTSSSDIKLCLGGEASGAIFRWNDAVVGSGGQVFRFYKNGGQSPVYLYKKSSGSTTYSLEPNCSAPTIIVNPTSLAFADTKVNGSSTMTFTVRGSNLTSNISLAVSGTNADMFSIDKTSLTPSEGSVASTTVTVTYVPTSTGSHSAEINLTSTDAITKTVHLTGAGKWEVTWMKDGEVYETTLVANGTKPTLPDTPTSFDATSNEFYGWATAEWKGRIDDLAGKTVYTSSDAMSTVNTSGRTYYAVFAKPEYAAGSAPVNTVLWAEDFSGYSDTDVPSGSVAYDHTGTTVYNSGSVSYTCTNGTGTKAGTTQVTTENEGNLAGGESPELRVGKKGTSDGAVGGTFVVSDIPNGGASELTVSYKQNANGLSVTASGTSYSGSKTASTKAEQSFDVTVGSGTMTLTFQATTANNVRVDEIEVKVKTRPTTYSRFMTNSREDMYVTSAKDIMTQASMTMNINRSAIKSGSVTIADVAGSQGGAFHAVITNGTANASTGLNATVEIQYTPTKANVSETATMTVVIGAADTYTFTVYGRSLPASFVIVANTGGTTWTALPADMSVANQYPGYGVTLDNTSTPTAATLAPEAALYTFYAGSDGAVRLAATDGDHALWASRTDTKIRNYALISGADAANYQWTMTTTDNVSYTLHNANANGGAGRDLCVSDGKWGVYASGVNSFRFLPWTSTTSHINMTVTDWDEAGFTFATSDDLPGDYDNVKAVYATTTDTLAVTQTGASSPYTLDISSIDFSAHSGGTLIIQWRKGYQVKAFGTVVTPIFIKTTVSDLSAYDAESLAAMDLHISGTLNISSNTTVHNVTIASGGSLNVTSSATFHVNSLDMQGGWNSSRSSYNVPRVYIASTATLTKTNSKVNYDLTIDKSNYYPLAVPFKVAVKGATDSIDYADAYLARFSRYGTHYVIKEYDGAARAEHGANYEGNWKVVESTDTLRPGKGYIITAVPIGGKAVIRIPLSFANTWTASGEQATVSKETKNVVAVGAYTGAATIGEGISGSRHKGWNLLGVPYMSCFTGSEDLYGTAELLNGKIVVTGGESIYGYEEDSEDVPYVSVPVHDFSEYVQTPVAEAQLVPGWCFFVQIGTAGNLTFLTSKQDDDSNMPIYAPQRAENEDLIMRTGIILSDEEASDKTTILVSDKYCSDYEIGADLEKMFGNGYTLATYSLSRDTRLAYNAMSTEDAKKVIPIGFRAPEDGEYTFSLNPRYAEAAVERVDLIDYQTGEVTNLMMSEYTFTTGRTQDDERFALNVVPMAKMPTGVEDSDVRSQNSDVRKIVIDDHVYIIRNGLMYDATGKRVTGINK